MYSFDPAWFLDLQKKKRSPYHKIDINERAALIAELIAEHFEKPISILIKPVSYHTGTSFEYISSIGRSKKTNKSPLSPWPQNYPPYEADSYCITLSPKYLRTSDEDLPKLIRYILFQESELKREVKRITNKQNPGGLIDISKFRNHVGDVFDLQELGKQLEYLYPFNKQIMGNYYWDYAIRNPLGFYCDTSNSDEFYFHRVVINPVLDDKSVPEYVVKGIIFHELLHAFFMRKCKKRDFYLFGPSRNYGHDQEFEKMMQYYSEFERYKKWCVENLKNLYARRHKKFPRYTTAWHKVKMKR